MSHPKLPSIQSFVKSLAILLSGVGLSHVAIAVAMTIIARTYNPTELAGLAVFVAIVSIIATPACMRFDVAISTSDSTRDAVFLFKLSVLLSLLYSCSVAALLFLINPSQFRYLESLGPHGWWLLPIGVWALSEFNALQFWMVRNRSFLSIAKSRILQVLIGSIIQIVGGLMDLGVESLIGGQIVVMGGVALLLSLRLIFKIVTNFRFEYLEEIKKLIFKYRFYPIYSAPESTLNIAAIQLPIILIATYSQAALAAQLFLAMKVLQMPMSFLGASISQVFLSEARQALKNGVLPDFVSVVIGGLLKTGAPFLILMGFISPKLFELIFGSSWLDAGTMVAWMVPWFLLQFLSSPVSMVLQVLGMQRKAFLLQLVGFILRVGLTLVSLIFFEGFEVYFYAISGGIFYFLYLIIVLYACGIRPSLLWTHTRVGVVASLFVFGCGFLLPI